MNIFNDAKNTYIRSKFLLEHSTKRIVESLKDKLFLKNFLREAIFNNQEVKYIAIEDTTYKKDNNFKIFERENLINILSEKLFPEISKAGKVPEDFNVDGQKVLLKYKKENNKNE